MIPEEQVDGTTLAKRMEEIGALASEHFEIQYVASILRDKLPTELNQEQNIALKLSQHSKLFRIEELRSTNL